MNFGILVFPDVEELDFVGPWEMAGIWSKFAEGLEQRPPWSCGTPLLEGQSDRNRTSLR